jgi:catechol 2,3-dioxygenase-like lactoylglutathione lyase family enzyme
MSRYLHTMYRITDPERSCASYEALGFSFARDLDIVRDGALEATNYFFSLGDQDFVLELTYNHDGRTYDLGTGYGHVAIGVDDLDAIHRHRYDRPSRAVMAAAIRGRRRKKATFRGSERVHRLRQVTSFAHPPPPSWPPRGMCHAWIRSGASSAEAACRSREPPGFESG